MNNLKKITGGFLILLVSACSEDPQGPVSSRFIDGGTYVPGGGETFCEIIPVDGITSNITATGVGGRSSLLKFGRNRNLEFNRILLDFNFDSLSIHYGKTVERVELDLSLVSSPDAELRFGIYPLTGSFTEDDSLFGDSSVGIEADPVPDETGSTAPRVLAAGSIEFGIDPAVVQGWLDQESDPWAEGVALVIEEEPDSNGFFEFYSINYGQDPIVMRVYFAAAGGDTFAVESDYSVPEYLPEGELAVIGGAATRLHFTFDLETLSDSAMVHYSALVLQVLGSEGFGITAGEQQLLGLDAKFFSYLYAPDSDDPADDAFWEGTGVDRQEFFATSSRKIEFPLRGYTNDVLYGSRENNGLVLQSDLENIRFQKVSFYSGEADSLNPYIKVIYSLPAEFK
jgi:hypothetical protein